MAGSGRTLRDKVRPATRATPLRPRPAPQVRASTQSMEPCAGGGGGGAADPPSPLQGLPHPTPNAGARPQPHGPVLKPANGGGAGHSQAFKERKGLGLQGPRMGRPTAPTSGRSMCPHGSKCPGWGLTPFRRWGE